MDEIPIFNREGKSIRSVDDWEVLASPGPDRWADGYSAKALAEAWIDGRGRGTLLNLLRDHGGGHFDDVRLERATAEAQTKFDAFGGPRNHDLLIDAIDSHGGTTIGLEGKANERFGETVAEYAAAADRKRARGESTNAPAGTPRLRGRVRPRGHP